MNCPYCGSEILDNSKFCPDCGRVLLKEKIIPEQKSIPPAKEKIYYDWLYNFLQENIGKAFTVRAFEQRLDPMMEKRREYGNFLQNILNRMIDNGIIKSTLHNGETHYFFPKTFRGEFKEPEIFDSGPEKIFDETPLEKAFEDKLYSYLEGHKRSAFTVESLVKRLKEIVKGLKERNYGRKNLQDILNKMRDKDIINSIQHEGKTFYWILDPEYPNKDPIAFFTSEHKISGESTSEESIIYGAGVILLIIGLILIGVGMAPINIALVITGGVLMIISICILSRGHCFECCDACS